LHQFRRLEVCQKRQVGAYYLRTLKRATKAKQKRKERTMTVKKRFTADLAKEIAEKLGIDWSKFDVEQFRHGMDVELEHGTVDPNTNVSNDDALITGKIALAHLNEFPDYYHRLDKMEEEAKDEPSRGGVFLKLLCSVAKLGRPVTCAQLPD
jgi:soluble cytochrome b562